MKTGSILFVLSFLAPQIHAHFVLKLPTSLGFNDATEADAPCGGSYDIKNRDKVTEFPTGGYPFHVLSTHSKSIFQYRAALLNSTTDWINLLPPISESGFGDFCLPAVPGHEAWEGLDAVVQVAQFGPDGTLFQCAAVKFVSGSALTPPSTCKNSSLVQASVTSVTAILPSGTGTLGVVLNTQDSNSLVQSATTTSSKAAATTSSGSSSSTTSTSDATAGLWTWGSEGVLAMIFALLGAWIL